MAVRINDGHPVYVIGLPQKLDHNGFNVDIAKTPGPMDHPHGVMARGADQSEASFNLPIENRHADCLGAAGTDKVRFRHHIPDIRDAKMDPLDVFDRHQIGFELYNAFDVEDSLFENLVLCVEKALFSLGMGGTDGPVESGEKNKPGFMFRT
jgi:hypothetical protein